MDSTPSENSCPLTRPVASVLVLNTLRPVSEPLLASIEGWRCLLTSEQWEGYRNVATTAAQRLEGEVQRNGSAVVFRGAPDVARSINAGLRAAGLTTSLNLLHTA
jgi:hypothetical protein